MSVSSANRGLRPGVCTSSTRPSNPFTGQIIYETDTGFLRVWDGSAWDYLSQSLDSWTTPRGVVGHDGSYATTAFSAATTLTVFTLSFTVQPSRRYMIFGRIGVQVTGTAATSNALWVEETTLGKRTLDYDTRAITQYHCKMFQGSVYCLASDFGVTSTAASKSLTLKWKCGASGGLNTDPDGIVGTNSLPHQITVMDIGPT